MKKCNRAHTSATVLNRWKHKFAPLWASHVKNFKENLAKNATVAVCDHNSGYQNFVEAFTAAVQPVIRDQFSNMVVTVAPAPVAHGVAQRFMATFEAMAADGVYPRLVFHGTPPANIPSICERGLLPPQKLNPSPDANHYTDAVWTATEAKTSISYCHSNNLMFACAVFDEKVKVKRPVAEDYSEDNDSGEAASSVPLSKESAKRPVNRRKGEKCLGKHQHRQTRRAIPSVKQEKAKETISYVGDWAVLVRDESYICPVLTVEWKVANHHTVKEDQWVPRLNYNTEAEDHAMQTLATAHYENTRYRNKMDLKLVWRRSQRATDIERRQLRLMKRDAQ